MEISDQDLQRRLNSPNNLVNHLKTVHGRGAGRPNLSEEQRDVVGKLAHSMPLKEVAETIGVSVPEVSACKSGRIGGRVATPERKAARALFVEETKDSALTKVMEVLGLIDEGKLSDCTAKELSSIAVNMARVHSALTPVQAGIQNQVNINIYAPEQRTEDRYKVVDA